MTGPLNPFTSKKVERFYLRVHPINGVPLAMVFRFNDGTKTIYPMFQYEVPPSSIAMNPSMPVPVEGSLDALLEDLSDTVAVLTTRVTALEQLVAGHGTRLTKVEQDYVALAARVGVAEADIVTLKKNGQLRCGNLTKTITKVVGGTEDFVVPLADGGFGDADWNAVVSIRDVGGVLGAVDAPMIIDQTATTCTVRIRATGVLNNKQVRVNVLGRRYVQAPAAAK